MRQSIKADRLEDLHELAITNAKLINNLIDRVMFLERQIPRNDYGYTEEQANFMAKLLHIAKGNDAGSFKYIPWHFGDYLDDFLKVQRKVQQIEFTLPMGIKNAFPDLDTDSPRSEDIENDMTGL